MKLKCYHGTTLEFAKSIIRENRFLPGNKEGLRLGEGAYFFQQVGESSYAIDCARDLEKYHYQTGKHVGEYAILSCTIECNDEEYIDLFDPENMEAFHQLRYRIYEEALIQDPSYQFVDAAHADTLTVNAIKNRRRVAIIRSPEFFGMFSRESRILMSGRRKYPKTFVPNIILVCADVELATIKDIQIIERGTFND